MQSYFWDGTLGHIVATAPDRQKAFLLVLNRPGQFAMAPIPYSHSLAGNDNLEFHGEKNSCVIYRAASEGSFR
jgi:hypothetical protein